MIPVNRYAIWPLIPQTIFIKHCWVEIIAFPFVLFHSNRFSMSAVFSVSNSLLHICLNSSSCHNVLTLLSLSGVVFHRRKRCWCAHMSLPANFQCSHRVVLVPFCIIYSLHLIVKCSAARPSPCFDTILYIVACVCSPLCHHLRTTFHIVAWVCSFVPKHL